MVKNRVLSFMSQWSTSPRSSSPSPPPINQTSYANRNSAYLKNPADNNDSIDIKKKPRRHTITNSNGSSTKGYAALLDGPRPTNFHESASAPIPSSSPRHSHANSPVADDLPDSYNRSHYRRQSRRSSRPLSMIMTYQPPVMDVTEDTIPELQPIFHFLNGHANKLYQEGYFLKLDDQNIQGKPNPDRTWTECFAQLVGTVLSLWDAAELDAAGENGEVLPKFINLTDASIKMIDSLPTRSKEEQPLENILSISTAGRNRYLLHFNSRQSLIQWTAGIRLAMFEHSSLQEAYTGALIAGKGKTLPNIGVIMERARIPVEMWVRVRFGAGVPWRRCWCAITPPDEKEYAKLQKELKKKSPYDRSHAPVLKGSIKFYDQRKEGKKQKKMQPIATITDAYSAYALYPQAKSLVDASTLLKIEGDITIHGDPPSSTEGFVFVMPEVAPAVSGFGMMLKYLFPTWDTFGLYGRPGKLVASVLDQRSLMFAMPKSKRYGYLEILDVSSVILTEGSSSWNEREWRKQLKELTGARMNAAEEGGGSSPGSRPESRSKRLSFGTSTGGPPKPRVGFADEPPPPPTAGTRSSRSFSLNSRPATRDDSTPGQNAPSPLGGPQARHSRNVSDPQLAASQPPQLRPHQDSPYSANPLSGRGPNPARNFVNDLSSTPERTSSDSEPTPIGDFGAMRNMSTPEPVSRPPDFSHAPGQRPANQPYHAPEMRRATSRLSSSTLAHLAKASGVPVGDDELANEVSEERGWQPPQQLDHRGPPPVHVHASASNDGTSTNSGLREALRDNQPMRSPGLPPSQHALANNRSRPPLNQHMGPPPNGPRGPNPGPPRSGTPDMRNPNPQPTTPGNQPPMGRGGPQQGGFPPRMPPSNMPPPGRGPPPHNMPPGRGYPNQPPNMYRGPPHGPSGPGGPGRPRSPPNHGPLPPLNTSPPIHRKPIPTRGDSLRNRQAQNSGAPETPSSSTSSFTAPSIDPGILDQVRPYPAGDSGVHRQNTGISQSSSHYDDAASTDSPDYASSRPSTDMASSVERPRAGVLRTVGNDEVSSPSAGLDIDFGPTLNLAAMPQSKTPTANTVSPTGPSSAGSLPPGAGPQPHSAVPAPLKSSGLGMGHSRQESDDTIRRSVVWHPASPQAANTGAAHSISPEQFVQQRAAAAAATPLYAHQRQPSNNSLSGYRAGTPTPPLNRNPTGDYIGAAHSRNGSQDLMQRPSSRSAGELLQRPGSRGAGAVLGGQGGVDSHLSARELEHVARVTGSPLINVAGNKNRPPIEGGLVGAINAREREKQQMKQGWSSQAAQHAISQRQQQQAFQQYQQPMGAPGLPPSGMYSNMGRGVDGGPRSPGPQSYGARAHDQGGNWSSPALGYPSPQMGNDFDPRYPPGQALSPPPGQQFVPPPRYPPAQSPPPGQHPGQQGRYSPGSHYHGQAF
ncbi:hypothetical protein DL766_009535 [Monosporascus sp. MC13-8B]|uniref:PH domain-containing protein n=1 Tax=Monosporascus cannonballus TaxID=155416 RepID=A0ABY0H2G7_9PEZI|nr:hypothetical protein DL762_006451 [Monosporascus cannonballus]RYO86018.1 hypothetical protein DL763_006888 [Monosporascus cannonballus]RYP14940.1 hypothetical protein DL766_009535 [Monosporascus sp. MC13-8B]